MATGLAEGPDGWREVTWGEAAELGPDRPMIVADHLVTVSDRDVRDALVAALERACDDARRDGVTLELAFVPESACVEDLRLGR